MRKGKQRTRRDVRTKRDLVPPPQSRIIHRLPRLPRHPQQLRFPSLPSRALILARIGRRHLPPQTLSLSESEKAGDGGHLRVDVEEEGGDEVDFGAFEEGGADGGAGGGEADEGARCYGAIQEGGESVVVPMEGRHQNEVGVGTQDKTAHFLT
jgi:hypothetical protein